VSETVPLHLTSGPAFKEEFQFDACAKLNILRQVTENVTPFQVQNPQASLRKHKDAEDAEERTAGKHSVAMLLIYSNHFNWLIWRIHKVNP
jgi:hypothetical protein